MSIGTKTLCRIQDGERLIPLILQLKDFYSFKSVWRAVITLYSAANYLPLLKVIKEITFSELLDFLAFSFLVDFCSKEFLVDVKMVGILSLFVVFS